MIDRPLSTKEAADKVGVNPNTLKSWLKSLPINPERDNAGNYRFDERAIEVLETIKQLRLDNRTTETIRRVIGKDQPEITQETPQDQPRANDGLSFDETRITQVITESISQAIAVQNELSEKYARAAHRIGELEATLREKERQLEEAGAKIALLSAPQEKPRKKWLFW